MVLHLDNTPGITITRDCKRHKTSLSVIKSNARPNLSQGMNMDTDFQENIL
jgi:hypothetical protein